MRPSAPARATHTSARLFGRARALMPGGVNSPVRAFGAVGGHPRFIAHGSGAHVVDVDDNRYIDYVGSWGAMILGHAHPEVTAAIQAQAARGTTFGMPSGLEVEMAETVQRFLPSLERVRMVNSGTEATAAAVRVARGVTGRPKIVKFEGCYHGHGDTFLIKAGSGAATFGVPDSPGVTAGTARDTLTARFNDLDSVASCFHAAPDEVAAVIVEPVVGNMGVVAPTIGFLEGLRRQCDANGALLIFDEVMTGFRVARGGAQQRYGVRPDLTTFGKIIGGGLPVGAYGGRADLMTRVAPEGPIYQAGTFSGNPLAMAAGMATLRCIERDPGFHDALEVLGARLEDGLVEASRAQGVESQVARVGSMWTLFFSARPVRDWPCASACDRAAYARFFHAMLDEGIALAPSQFEANFISAAHTAATIDSTIAAAHVALAAARA